MTSHPCPPSIVALLIAALLAACAGGPAPSTRATASAAIATQRQADQRLEQLRAESAGLGCHGALG